MTAELILRFDRPEDLERVLRLLKELGLDRLIVLPEKPSSNQPEQESHSWPFGISNLHGGLDQVNIRDYAYED